MSTMQTTNGHAKLKAQIFRMRTRRKPSHTTMPGVGRVEVVASMSVGGGYSLHQKLAVLTEAAQLGTSSSRLTRRQVFLRACSLGGDAL